MSISRRKLETQPTPSSGRPVEVINDNDKVVLYTAPDRLTYTHTFPFTGGPGKLFSNDFAEFAKVFNSAPSS